jgi:hypothetical protein
MPKFEYEKHQYIESEGCHSGQEIFRPILGIALENDGKFSDPLPCLIDSGGDWCLFPLDFLEPLGMEKIGLGIDYPQGLGEGCEAYFGTVTIHAMNLGFWEASVGFSAKLNGKGFGVLGQNGFFDQCKVLFDRPNFSFEILL